MYRRLFPLPYAGRTPGGSFLIDKSLAIIWSCGNAAAPFSLLNNYNNYNNYTKSSRMGVKMSRSLVSSRI